MEEIIILLYLGFVTVALVVYTQFSKAKQWLFQVYVPSTLIGAGIILLLCYGEYESHILYGDNEKLILLFCLMIPFGGIALSLLLYQLFNIKSSPGKLPWFGFSALSLLILVTSPLLSLLLPTKGNNYRIHLIESFDFNIVLGLGYFLIALGAMGFILRLGHQPIKRIRKYLVWGGLGAVVLIALWYWQALSGNHAGEVISYPGTATIVIATLAIPTMIDFALRKRQQLAVGGLTIAVSLFMVWSPYIGSVGIFEACNAIHRWQLDPLVAGLRQYKEDGGRYPLGFKALTPYYLVAPPTLFCLGGVETPYYMKACGDEMVFLLRTQKDLSRWQVNLDVSDRWRFLPADREGCYGAE